MSAEPKRNALILALTVLGHEHPEHIISNAQGVADIMARLEEGGEPEPSDQDCRDYEAAQGAAKRLEEYLPAVWEFAKAGHQGGGGA